VTPANLFDITIQLKPETEEIKADELKHILDYLPALFRELALMTDDETQE